MNRITLWRYTTIIICLTFLTGCDQQSREMFGLSQPWPDDKRAAATAPAGTEDSTDPAPLAPANPSNLDDTAIQPKSVTTETRPPTAAPDLDHEDLDATAWVQLSAEYHAIALQTYRMATEHLQEAVANKSWSAVPSQSESLQANPRDMPMAVVLDLDETVMDNSGFQAEMIQKGTQFSPTAWDEWEDAKKARADP